MSLAVSMMRSIGKNNAVLLVFVTVCLSLTAFNISQLQSLQQRHIDLLHPAFGTSDSDATRWAAKPSFVVFAKNPDSGYLKHVYAVLQRGGFVRTTYNLSDEWSLMWAHDYPFKKIKHVIMSMKPFQKVNKLPGSGFVTNKVNLATSNLSHIPPAFRIPNDTAKLKEYAARNPHKMFVQKNQNHRGIKIEKIEDLDLKSAGSFVQEYVDDPLLIDGYKFDIGVYTIITSVDPLRIYVYNGDVLLRFCPEKYNPFDPSNRDQYVVHDDYRPTWEVPTLAHLYSGLGFTFKETFNAHIRTLKHDPDQIWAQVYDVIREVYSQKEADLIQAASTYPYKRAFFEMVRFDFVLDAKLNLYLMEVNMSPNLSSKHFAANRLLYEQVIYNVLRLAGIARGGLFSGSLQSTTKEEEEMQVSDKDLYVFPEECASQDCSKLDSCRMPQCQLCKHCISDEELNFFREAYLEHVNRHTCKRIFPEPINRALATTWLHGIDPAWQKRNFTPNNLKMNQWWVGKCLADPLWCH